LRVAYDAGNGVPDALAQLETVYFRGIDAHLKKLGLGLQDVDDVKQMLLQQMLVGGGPDEPPRITQYDGRGALRGWIRISAIRQGIKLLRVKQREVLSAGEGATLDDAMLADRAAPADAELAYMKALYRDAFRACFAEALATLSARDKTLIRQSLLDGLSIDELAHLYGTHRATTARWLQSARAEVVTETRRRFVARLNVSAEECDSVFRLISTHLDITLRRHLVA
jgi:RNA polymerase sigma-70 factor